LIACSSSTNPNLNEDGGSKASSDATTDARIDAKAKDASEKDAFEDAGKDAADSAPEDAGDASQKGAPSLTDLSVLAEAVTDASPQILVVPAFSPEIHDYYVRCAAGTNALTVSMTASSGSDTLLVQPTASPSLPKQTRNVGVLENQALVVAATDGIATTEYWVRCLPHDFPFLEMTAHAEAGAPPPGYYLVGNLLTAVSGGYAIVLNGEGVPVWYHRSPTGLGAIDVDNVVSGALSFMPYAATKVESFEIHQLSPLVTTLVAPAGVATDPHELRVLPNGDYLVLSYPLKSGVDLTGLNITLAGDVGVEALGPNSTIQDCEVVEFSPAGTVVSTWLASDHFNPAAVSTLPLTGFGAGATLPDGGPVYDVFHCNSVDVDPANGNFLISAREMDSIFYVDHASGEVVWKMGGLNASLDGAAFVSVADPFFRQHDARLQLGWSSTCSGGKGQISLFDDESAPGPAGPARAVLYDVVVGGGDAGIGDCDGGAAVDGGAPGTATLAWQYRGLVRTAATGSFRISADGSCVIGWGLGGTPDLAFTEVDIHGNDLLDFKFTDGNSTYRAIKVPLAAFDLGVLRSTAGLP